MGKNLPLRGAMCDVYRLLRDQAEDSNSVIFYPGFVGVGEEMGGGPVGGTMAPMTPRYWLTRVTISGIEPAVRRD